MSYDSTTPFAGQRASRTGMSRSGKFLGRVRECRCRFVLIREGREAAGEDPVEGVLAERESERGAALDDDLNVSEALASLASLVRDLMRLSPDAWGEAAALSLFRKLGDWIACFGEEPGPTRCTSSKELCRMAR